MIIYYCILMSTERFIKVTTIACSSERFIRIKIRNKLPFIIVNYCQDESGTCKRFVF